MGGVLISYQAEPALVAAHRLAGALTKRLGKAQVGTLAGQTTERPWDDIRAAIIDSNVVLVMVDSRWRDRNLRGRSNRDPEWYWADSVLEIAHGAEKPTVGVLIDGADPPSEHQEWAALEHLQEHEPLPLDTTALDESVESIAEVLATEFGVSPQLRGLESWSRAKKIAGAVVAVMGGVITTVTFWNLLFGDPDNRRPIIQDAAPTTVVAGTTEWIDLLGRVEDPDGDPLILRVERRADESDPEIKDTDQAGVVAYTAPIGSSGPHEFDFWVVDPDGAEARGTVFVEVLAGPMEGPINIAVAGLDVVEGSDPDLARAATAFLDDIAQAAVESDEGLRIAYAGPVETGTVEADDRTSRLSAAAETAKRLEANAVVFGDFSTNGDTAEILLRFYLHPRDLAGADELVGLYDFEQLKVSPAGEAALQLRMDQHFGPSLTALAGFLRALGHYQANDYGTAETALDTALETWPHSATSTNGEEVVWQLLGNVRGEQNRLEDAAAAYQTAADLADRNARALFGLTEVAFLGAAGPKCGRDTPPDLPQLEAAIDVFNDILTHPEPQLSFLHARSEFEIARVELCLTRNGDDRAESARQRLDSLIARYDAEPRLDNLIGEVHQALALYHTIRGRPADALAEYELAIASSTEDERLAFFHGATGGIYECDLDEHELARLAYETSDDLADEPLERRTCSDA